MSGGPCRRVVLRDGVLVVLGLAAGCQPEPGAGKPLDSGAGTGAGGGGTDADFDPCADHPDAGGDGWSAISLSTFSALAAVGGSVSVDLDGHRLAVAQPAEGCFVAVSRICTHQGCETAYDAGRFVCPCHGAVFDLDGSVLGGPTPVPVEAFPAAKVGGVVWVRTR